MKQLKPLRPAHKILGSLHTYLTPHLERQEKHNLLVTPVNPSWFKLNIYVKFRYQTQPLLMCTISFFWFQCHELRQSLSTLIQNQQKYKFYHYYMRHYLSVCYLQWKQSLRVNLLQNHLARKLQFWIWKLKLWVVSCKEIPTKGKLMHIAEEEFLD